MPLWHGGINPALLVGHFLSTNKHMNLIFRMHLRHMHKDLKCGLCNGIFKGMYQGT